MVMLRGQCGCTARTVWLHCKDSVVALRGQYTARAVWMYCEDSVVVLRGQCGCIEGSVVVL